MPDRQGNLTPDEQRDMIVQALMQGLYPQAGDPVRPLPGLFPGGQTLNSAQLALNPLASNGGADPFTQPGVDYLPSIQYGPGNGGPASGAPGAPADNTGGLTFGGLDTGLTGAGNTGGFGNLGGGPYSGVDSPTDLGPPGSGNAPGFGGPVGAGNSTATPSGSNPPGFEGAPSAVPGESVTYGGPQSAQSVIDEDFNELGASMSPSSPGFGATQGVGYTGYSGVPGMGLEGNTGLVGGYSATDPGFSAYTGSMPGGFNATSPTDLVGPQTSLEDPSQAFAAAYTGQTPGLEADVTGYGLGGYGFGDPSAGDYTGDTSFGDSAPAGGGISDGSYGEATSGGGYGTDGFDGFGDGFDDGYGDDDDDDGDDDGGDDE